jgi:hypothetical protein
MAAPATNALSVLHPQYASHRELCICDETQTDQSASKFGWGVAPVAASSRASFTMTYNVGGLTIAAMTAVAVATTAATNSSPYGYAQAQADAIVAAVNALIVDVLAMKKNDVSIITALKALGLAV